MSKTKGSGASGAAEIVSLPFRCFLVQMLLAADAVSASRGSTPFDLHNEARYDIALILFPFCFVIPCV